METVTAFPNFYWHTILFLWDLCALQKHKRFIFSKTNNDNKTIAQAFNFDAAIERHKTKLLDLSRRNQLLNFRFFKRSIIKIVDEIPSEIFKDIVVNNKKFDFLPKPETEEDHELEISLESIEHHVYDSISLPDKHTDTSLQTDQNVKDLLLGLRNIQSKSREFVEEKGVNVLFLALGMINWKDEKLRLFQLLVNTW